MKVLGSIAGLIIAFAIVMVVSYRRDRSMHLKNYRGVKWVFLTFAAFFLDGFAFA